MMGYGGIAHQRDLDHRCALDELDTFSDLLGNVLVVLTNAVEQSRVLLVIGKGSV